MENLSHSDFFDGRIRSAVSAILLGQKAGRAISADEQRFFRDTDAIVSLNDEVHGKLLQILSEASGHTAFADALTFLLHASRIGQLQDALYVLELATRENRTLTRGDLSRLLDDARTIPMGWGVHLLGNVTAERPAENKRSSSIDMNRLRGLR